MDGRISRNTMKKMEACFVDVGFSPIEKDENRYLDWNIPNAIRKSPVLPRVPNVQNTTVSSPQKRKREEEQEPKMDFSDPTFVCNEITPVEYDLLWRGHLTIRVKRVKH